jgi:ring-1,2-phenylacetyl-CoA epoxidase subunit PaaE
MSTEPRTDWPTLGLIAGMYAVLAGNFALYWNAPLPLAVHVFVSVAAIHVAFTVWHESVHRNVSSRQWLNDTVGVLGIFPYMAPFYYEKWFHLLHHVHLNQPDDPNFIYVDGPFWKIPLRYPRILRYAFSMRRDDPRTPEEKRIDWLVSTVVVGGYAVAYWQGVFADLVLLWFVPFVLSKIVMDWYINYLPHVGLPPDRFRGTRIVDVRWLTFALVGHNDHATHHLWPSIPWHRYRATFREKLEYLGEHGVPIEHRVLRRRFASGESV